MANANVALKAMREGAGLSLRDLAELCDPPVSFVYLSQVERGLREPSERWLRTVTQALATHAIERRAS
jgi:transcriptional regulator with XRE-family HTH domain